MGQSTNPISLHETIHDNTVDFSGAAGSLVVATPVRADAGGEQARYFPVGCSARMEYVRHRIEEVTGSLAPVLITGEPGTGKEWTARYMHARSPRHDQPFVSVDCTAIAADSLEGELFGYEKGAVSDSLSSGSGYIEAAQDGTLFLDDFTGMNSRLLGKLLNALRQRSYQRVGSNRSRPCDVRLIMAAADEGEQGREAYEEIFFGAQVAQFELPPLRERIEDLADVVESIAARSDEFGLETIRLTPGALRILRHYDWPGNIRELANLMQRLSLLYPERLVDIPDLPAQFTDKVPLRIADHERVVTTRVTGPRPQDIDLPAGRIPLKRYLEDIEIALIRRALHETNGVIAHAATYLHLRRTTLAEKIKRYGLRANDAADLNVES